MRNLPIRCPHCDGIIRVNLPITPSGHAEPQFITCDETEGGCGEMFAFGAKVTIEAVVWKLEQVR